MFSQKHYVEIAKLLKAQYDEGSSRTETLDSVVDEFVSMFGDDNPNFSREKFLTAVWGDA